MLPTTRSTGEFPLSSPMPNFLVAGWYKCGVLKPSVSIAIAAVISFSLAACSDSSQNEAFETQSPEDIEFKTITEAGEDVSSRLPEESAWGCESRTVRTTDGFYTLKNADVLNGDEATYYFAPYKNMNYSYSLRIQFENGTVNVRDERNGMKRAFVQIVGSPEIETSSPVGGTYLTSYIPIPAEYEEELGELWSVSASINGEHAGTCKVPKSQR